MSHPSGYVVIALGNPLGRNGAQRGPMGPRASVVTPSSGFPKATPKGRADFGRLRRCLSVTMLPTSLPPRALHSAKIDSVTAHPEGWDTV